jgi:hypothetical protein
LFYALYACSFRDITRTLCERSTSMILLAVQRSISHLTFPFSASVSSFGVDMASISEVQQVRVHGSRRSPSVGISSQNGGTKRRPCIILIVHQRLHVCCIFVSFIPVWVWLKHAIPYAPQHRGFTMVSSHVTLPSLEQRPSPTSSIHTEYILPAIPRIASVSQRWGYISS